MAAASSVSFSKSLFQQRALPEDAVLQRILRMNDPQATGLSFHRFGAKVHFLLDTVENLQPDSPIDLKKTSVLDLLQAVLLKVTENPELIQDLVDAFVSAPDEKKYQVWKDRAPGIQAAMSARKLDINNDQVFTSVNSLFSDPGYLTLSVYDSLLYTLVDWLRPFNFLRKDPKQCEDLTVQRALGFFFLSTLELPRNQARERFCYAHLIYYKLFFLGENPGEELAYLSPHDRQNTEAFMGAWAIMNRLHCQRMKLVQLRQMMLIDFPNSDTHCSKKELEGRSFGLVRYTFDTLTAQAQKYRDFYLENKEALTAALGRKRFIQYVKSRDQKASLLHKAADIKYRQTQKLIIECKNNTELMEAMHLEYQCWLTSSHYQFIKDDIDFINRTLSTSYTADPLLKVWAEASRFTKKQYQAQAQEEKRNAAQLDPNSPEEQAYHWLCETEALEEAANNEAAAAEEREVPVQETRAAQPQQQAAAAAEQPAPAQHKKPDAPLSIYSLTSTLHSDLFQLGVARLQDLDLKKRCGHAIHEVSDHLFLATQDLALLNQAIDKKASDEALLCVQNLIVDTHVAMEQRFALDQMLDSKQHSTSHDLKELASHLTSLKLNGDQLAFIHKNRRGLLWARYPEQSAWRSSLLRLATTLSNKNPSPEEWAQLKREAAFHYTQTLGILCQNRYTDALLLKMAEEAMPQEAQSAAAKKGGKTEKRLEALHAKLSEALKKPLNLSQEFQLSPKTALQEVSHYLAWMRTAHQMRASMPSPHLNYWHLRNCLMLDKAFEQLYASYRLLLHLGYEPSHNLTYLHELVTSQVKLPFDASEISPINLGTNHHYPHLHDHKPWGKRCRDSLAASQAAAAASDGFQVQGQGNMQNLVVEHADLFVKGIDCLEQLLDAVLKELAQHQKPIIQLKV
jgi:hypothetical protein